MLISAAVLTDAIRATIPCTLLSASQVPFATISLGIGGLSWIVPKRVFVTLDNTLYQAYMRLCLFVFENLSSVQIKLHGDIEILKQKPERVLVLANHQSNVDWAVLIMLAARQGTDGSEFGFRVMVKQAIHLVPLFGWYIFQHGYIYVRRFGGFISGPVRRQLKWLDGLDENFWLLIFPEGTRYSRKYSKKIEESQDFCRKNRLHELQNVLHPRSGGILLALQELKLDAIYDVTIGYGQTRNNNRRGLAPGMFEFCCGPYINRTLSVHVKRYPIENVPKEEEELRKWVFERYVEKDKIMDNFYSTGEFPEPIELNESTISLTKTLPPTLFFTAAIIAPFFSPLVKKTYFYTIASFPLLIIWLRVRKCV